MLWLDYSVQAFVAAIGPATQMLEAAAAAVGAGMVLGAFFAGLASGLVLLRRGADLERSVVMPSCVGGLLGLLALISDWAR